MFYCQRERKKSFIACYNIHLSFGLGSNYFVNRRLIGSIHIPQSTRNYSRIQNRHCYEYLPLCANMC